MEQKQLDELDESFFGEEFIEEEDFSKEFRTKPKDKTTKKFGEKMTEKLANKKTKLSKNGIKPQASMIKKTVKAKSKIELNLDHSQDKEYPEIKITPEMEEANEEVSIMPAVEEPKTSSTCCSTDEDDNGGDKESFFSKASTWQVLFVLVGILLVFSLLTQGFNLVGSPTGGVILPLAEAESKALNYINTNLLQPPYTAEVKNSQDRGNLYQLTLSVAGQEIDSYLTKDGKLFFPQGFELTETTTETTLPEPEIQEAEEVESETEEIPEQKKEESTSKPAAPTTAIVPTTPINQFTIIAKKWSFQPNTITIKKGEVVKLNLILDQSTPAFALAQMNFAIPGLDLEKSITGTTEVSFTAAKPGRFEFKCSSCEDWRGMTGIIIVE